MTDRIPLDDMSSDDLDELYERAEQAEAAIERVRALCNGEWYGITGDAFLAALDQQQPTTTEVGPSPQQPAYNAVYAYIRTLPVDFLPTTVVDRNAMIWHAVNAALDRQQQPTAMTGPELREQLGQALRHWGLLDEVNDPQATEDYAVTDLLAVFSRQPTA